MTKPHIRIRADVDGVRPSRGFGGWNNPHHGASLTNREVAGWHASRGSADADLLRDLPQLQYRARDIRRNNGFAHSIVETSVDNIVGTGLRLCSEPDYLALQKIDKSYDKAWADDWAAQYESLWHEYWWSTACHAGDTKTGDMLCEEFMYSKFDSGGILILPLWIPDRGDGFSTKLQTVEIDRLSNPNGMPDSKYMRGGVEFDEFGVPLFYNIRKGHPGDTFLMMSTDAFTWERIPRRTPFGRLRVIHDFDGDRPDQTRGKPLFSAVLDQFKNIDRYVKAEIQAALLNAMIAGVITTPMDQDAIVAMFNEHPEDLRKWREQSAVSMQAGTFMPLAPGDKLEPFIPQRPAAQFGVFVENVEAIIAVGAGMPHIIGKKDYSQSNYSNTRAALVDAWKTFNRRRDRLGAGALDPVNGLFMEEMVNAGRIEAPRFYEFRRAYQRCSWIGPGQGYIDKVKEATGDLILLDGNLMTRKRLCAAQGQHWREVADQCAAERAYLEKLGLPTISPTSVRVTSSETPDQTEAGPPQKPQGEGETIDVEFQKVNG